MFSFLKKKPLYVIHLSEDTGVPPIPVYENKVTIGRGTQHVLAIPDNSISRNHLEVNFNKGVIFITDLGTSNGTKINEEPLPANVPVPYKEGQVLRLGQSKIRILFEIYKPKK